jgi:hypothetical protein
VLTDVELGIILDDIRKTQPGEGEMPINFQNLLDFMARKKVDLSGEKDVDNTVVSLILNKMLKTFRKYDISPELAFKILSGLQPTIFRNKFIKGLEGMQLGFIHRDYHTVNSSLFFI